MKKNTYFFLTVLFLSSAVFAEPNTFVQNSKTQTQQSSLTPITLQLRWLHQFQFAGYYAAKEKGIYRDMGFDVTIVSGAPGRDPQSEVLEGRAQYGISNSDILLKRMQGHPLVALAAVFQHSPAILLVKQESGIRSPQHLIGKKVMSLGKAADVGILAMLTSEGADKSQVNFLKSSYDINDLVNGKTDAFSSYLTNEPYYLNQLGIPFSILNPSTYGIDFYSDILFTSENEIEKAPEQVKNFREASLLGWQYALEHPEELIDIIQSEYGSDKTLDHLRFEAKSMIPLIMANVVEIGHMNIGRWHHMADTFVKANLAAPDYSLDGFVYNPDPIIDIGPWIITVAILATGISIIGGLVIFLVISNRKLANSKASLQLQSAIIENMAEGVTLVRVIDQEVVFTNTTFDAMFGYESTELIGQHVNVLNAENSELCQETSKAIMASLEGGNTWSGEMHNKKKDGSEFWCKVKISAFAHHKYGKVWVSVHEDVTELKQAEDKIKFDASHDHLTSLPNRTLFTEHLSKAIASANRKHNTVAVLFLDLDGFKSINDDMGHEAGDIALRLMAKRLADCVREEDTVGRYGGDEFTICLVGITCGKDVSVIAQKILNTLATPFKIDENEQQIGASIGIALFPEHGKEQEDLIHQADVAMYKVKKSSKNAYNFASAHH